MARTSAPGVGKGETAAAVWETRGWQSKRGLFRRLLLITSVTVLILVASGLATAPAGPSTAAHGLNSGGQQRTGPLGRVVAPAAVSPITNRLTDQIHPAIVHSTQADEYLVVWQDHYWGSGDIYGQRTDAAGALAGGVFPVSWVGGGQRESPVVAYGPVADEYLVVWEYVVTADNHDIYARTVASDGSLPTGEISITVQTNYDSNPAIAYNSADDEYLIVWERHTGSDEVTGIDTYGQRIDADGTLLGAPIVVANSTSDESAPAVAFDSSLGQYLVVWQERAFGAVEYDIHGQLIEGGGGLVGGEIGISTWGNDQVKPRLAFNSGANEYLVVWQDHYWGPADIYGRRVNADGTLDGSSFPVSWEGANGREAPDVAYKAAVDEYLVVWEYEYNGSDHDVYQRRVGSDGTLMEDETGISAESSWEARPVVAADDQWSYLVV